MNKTVRDYELMVWEVIEAQELRNKGWLFAGECPSLTVSVDGIAVDKVVRVNRSLGIAVAAVQPMVINPMGEAVTKELKGLVDICPVIKGKRVFKSVEIKQEQSNES